MIRPILYPDIVAVARVVMHDPNALETVSQLCDRAHEKGWSLEEAAHDLPKVDGFSLNSNRGLGAIARVIPLILKWRRERGFP